MNDLTAAARYPACKPTLRDLDDRDSLAARIAQLDAQAQAAWVRAAQQYRWTLWVRLSWSWPVAEFTAVRHLTQWATALRQRAPGTVILVGVHTNTERRHAHALLYMPRRGAPRWRRGRWLEKLAVTWLQWPHGLAWVRPYAPGRTAQHHGAAEYLSREVGTVQQFGHPVPYRPRRKRR
jgi:hypothetical protein